MKGVALQDGPVSGKGIDRDWIIPCPAWTYWPKKESNYNTSKGVPTPMRVMEACGEGGRGEGVEIQLNPFLTSAIGRRNC